MDRKDASNRREKMAVFWAFLAAALYTLNAPISKLLLKGVGPTMILTLTVKKEKKPRSIDGNDVSRLLTSYESCTILPVFALAYNFFHVL